MKKLFDLVDDYILDSDWTDFALVKICAGALGLLFGLCVSPRNKKLAFGMGALAFVASLVPLMSRFLPYVTDCDCCDCGDFDDEDEEGEAEAEDFDF